MSVSLVAPPRFGPTIRQVSEALGGRSEQISQICVVWGKAVALSRYQLLLGCQFPKISYHFNESAALPLFSGACFRWFFRIWCLSRRRDLFTQYASAQADVKFRDGGHAGNSASEFVITPSLRGRVRTQLDYHTPAISSSADLRRDGGWREQRVV